MEVSWRKKRDFLARSGGREHLDGARQHPAVLDLGLSETGDDGGDRFISEGTMIRSDFLDRLAEAEGVRRRRMRLPSQLSDV